jgi:hypothetical protein
MGMSEGVADLCDDLECLVNRDPVILSFAKTTLEVAAGHVLTDDIDLSALFDDIVDGDDVRMVAQTPHGLGFAADARETAFVESFRLDDGDCHVAVETSIVRKIYSLFRSFADETLDLISS